MSVKSPTVDDVYRVLGRSNGKRPILLPIEAGEKGARWWGWRKVTYEASLTPDCQKRLQEKANTGVLLGGDDNLCAIDCDTDAFLTEFLRLNPQFEKTLRTRGISGAQLWVYLTGDRPHQVHKLTVHKDSPLAANARKKGDEHVNIQIGEFRAEGGQSIIRGIHPDNCDYVWLVDVPPVTVDFDAIVWPEDVRLPWIERRPTGTNGVADDSLLHRAIERLTIDQLWQYFGFEPRTVNPTNSPFREDRHPSFSVYDQGRRWKDHGTGEGGDSFDFYQRASRKNASQAFVEFVELAGLGAELKAPRKRNKSCRGAATVDREEGAALKSAHSAADIAKTLGIYYDPERSCYWMQDDRANWIKINEGSVERHLEEAGYETEKGKGETVSQTDRILNAIQISMNVEFAGSLAGHEKGVLEYHGRRFLILDSPRIIEPAKGNWPTLQILLENVLDAENSDQIIYFNGWMKTALVSLRSHLPRPGQALVLTGVKDCGKSLLQSVITELLGGRMARPYLYMSGQTSFNGDLFGAEHLCMEDEEPHTDIKSRRNFGTKIKEITAIDDQHCHKKFRDGITLPVFWRLTISLNDETENLLILPPFDDSISDKIMIFKAKRCVMPMATALASDRKRFREQLSAELPAYVDYLLNTWVIDPADVSQRYGITHYHDLDILVQLAALAPETRLLQLIDAEIFENIVPTGPRTTPWTGTALELEQRLTQFSSDVQRQAQNLLNWQGSAGTYLSRLKKLHPKRISLGPHKKGINTWVINSP
jgi:hypothetical protein